MTLSLIKPNDRAAVPGLGPEKNLIVKAGDYNPVVTQVNTNTDDITDLQASVTALEGYDSTSNPNVSTIGREITALVTLTATQIVGTSAGDIGHASGAILVAAPSSAYALEFISAVFIYDFATDAYTGGANDAVIRVGTVAHTAALTDANYITAAGDKVYVVRALTTGELSLPVGSTINLAGTAFTNPGTAAGVLRVHVKYRVHTTSL